MTTDPSALLAGAAGSGQRLGLALKQAEQAMMAAKAEALRDLGLTVPQYAVLLQLADRPGRSGAQLARGAAVTPQTMAGVLANLEAKDLIAREPSEVHGKVLVTRLTDAGRDLLTEADARAVGVEAALWSAFDDAERELFRAFLQRATAALGR
ncbi:MULTISPECIES: MarR family winged helix-turn-helix transcriptional regulator [Kitasatospora]|uniref:DNA-binding MarR family transcriptional regulator n=2 Tax=Kitasatospora TaxID=2063 RepID=A0ABT1J519_9ACTN|nr:MarR family transcriptional regulator [Kitasatospora paracochleata]MCP2312531.1 DNA-binding MarR family transcriptional regulator [Kitasatospora paracochleata]